MGSILLACVGTREILSNIDPLSVPFLSNLNDAWGYFFSTNLLLYAISIAYFIGKIYGWASFPFTKVF